MPGVFEASNSLMIITSGPGTLTLLTYAGAKGLSSVIGSKKTTTSGTIRWFVGFSHNYTRFAFMWEGGGQAVYRIGSTLLTEKVGTDWKSASLVSWGSGTITTADVSEKLIKRLIGIIGRRFGSSLIPYDRV